MRKNIYFNILILCLITVSIISCDNNPELKVPVEEFVTINSIRKMYQGEPVVIKGKNAEHQVFISGIVISDYANKNFPEGKIVVQNFENDKLRGIVLSVAGNIGRYLPGDSVIARVDGKTLERDSVYQLLQISGLTIADVGKISSNNTQRVQMETGNFENILANMQDYESTLVSLLDVQVLNVQSGRKFGDGDLTLSDGVSNIYVRTLPTALFAALDVAERGNFKGIFLPLDSQPYLMSRSAADFTYYEVLQNKLPLADPYVLYYDGTYYAYGTRGINGFEVYISYDLKHWKKEKNLALSPENSWGSSGYWAPEVHYVSSKNKFYMFYTVNEHICVATSNSPKGPFVQDVKKPIIENEKAIDPSLFVDDDGTPYLFFVRYTNGNIIWVAEMNNDLKSIKTATLTQCISPKEKTWERVEGKIAEGPSVLKYANTYYLIYSANPYQSQDYAVGYAEGCSPFGPWAKYSANPILRRDLPAAAGLFGTGHGAPFMTAEGTYKYIFHAHASATAISPRSSYINDLNISSFGEMSIGGTRINPVLVK